VRASLRSSWPAVRLFLLTRAAIWLFAIVVVVVAPDRLGDQAGLWGPVDTGLPGAITDVWMRWDAGWYARIAELGYRWPSATPAFFPLLPLLLAPLGRLLGGSYALAGVAVSLVAGSLAIAGMHRLGVRRLDRRAADRAVLYLCVFPTAVFLGAPYAEALFLALAVGTFLLAERGSLAAAGVVAGLAVLTRPQGAAVVAALGVLAWQARGPRGLAVLGLPAALFALYPLALWLWIGRPLAFVEAQEQWQRGLHPLGPVGGVLEGLRDGDLLGLGVVALFVPLAAAAWRMLGTAYGVYAVTALAIPLSLPSARYGGLYSLPRFALVAFPCFLVLGLLGRRWPVHVAVLVVSVPLLALAVGRWALWWWVA
jgi:hypothetical protein